MRHAIRHTIRLTHTLFALPLLALLATLAGCGEKASTPAGGAPAAGGGESATSSTTAAAADSSDEARLIIMSPHDEAVKREVGLAFVNWYAKNNPNATAPKIDWQDRGGSVEDNKYIVSAFGALKGKEDQGINIDVYFGGGAPAHTQLKQKDLIAKVELPAATVSSIPAQLSGVALRDPDNRWFGVVLSSFGIIYNKPQLKAKNLAEPKTWEDLANPGYVNTLILADPAKSGSARVCYEVMLQKYGWEKGWGLLMQLAGNTREFASKSSAVPQAIANGSALAGVCVDYHGFSQIAQTGADVVGYVSPENATAITPDPIGMLRGAPHPELAKQFIAFTLSPECQALFGLKKGSDGGPQTDLWRMPVLPAFYEQHKPETILFSINPFKAASTFNVNEKIGDARAPLLGPLFAAAFINNKQHLLNAWQVVLAHPTDAALLAKFTATPFTEAEAMAFAAKYSSSPREAIELDRQWQQAFRKRYEEIEAAGK